MCEAKIKFVQALLVALLALSASAPAQASRTMFTTIIQNTLTGTDSYAWSLGGSTLATVTLKNISNQTQTITATMADQSVLMQAFFKDEPTGKKDLPSWTENPTYTNVRYTTRTPNPVSMSLTLAPMASGTLEFDIFCVNDDPGTCYSGGDPTGLSPNYDVNNISFQSRFSIQVTVNEDRGAVLADLNIEMRIFTSPAVGVVDSTRSLNGGRPF